MVNFVLNDTCQDATDDCPQDSNGDGIVNIVDIVALVNFVLNDACEESNLDDCGVPNGNNDCLALALAQANLVLENVTTQLMTQWDIQFIKWFFLNSFDFKQRMNYYTSF